MSDTIASRPTPWATIILLCGKCARKMKGGYGANTEETLRTALKGELRAKGQARSVRVIETRCMGLCPKKAVIALNASAPGNLLTIPKGTKPADALVRLLQETPAQAE